MKRRTFQTQLFYPDSCQYIGFKLYNSSKKPFLNHGKHNNFTIEKIQFSMAQNENIVTFILHLQWNLIIGFSILSRKNNIISRIT